MTEVADSREDKRGSHQTSSVDPVSAHCKGWNEPGLADTLAASAQGPSASPAPLGLGFFTALERNDEEKGTSQSTTRWVFRLDGCLVPSWRCREIGDPLLPYESGPAHGLHGTIRTPLCIHLSPRHTWLGDWLRPSRGEEHGGRILQETWV